MRWSTQVYITVKLTQRVEEGFEEWIASRASLRAFSSVWSGEG